MSALTLFLLKRESHSGSRNRLKLCHDLCYAPRRLVNNCICISRLRTKELLWEAPPTPIGSPITYTRYRSARTRFLEPDTPRCSHEIPIFSTPLAQFPVFFHAHAATKREFWIKKSCSPANANTLPQPHLAPPRRIPHHPRRPNRKPVTAVGTSNSWDFL
jgi:hypothetical protein